MDWDWQTWRRIRAEQKRGAICGWDDSGKPYHSLQELSAWQDEHRAAFYAANEAWWEAGGCGGSTDEAAMTGDDESDVDVADSHRFLTSLRARHPALLATPFSAGLDAGAGVGRVTKHLLLRHCRTVHLVEASEAWNKQSRRYLGRKRSLACTFVRSRLEDFVPRLQSFDLIWVQWVFQYMTDADMVRTLSQLKAGLRHGRANGVDGGVLVLKENRPYLAGQDESMFQIDTPAGEHGRYDITRPDEHHRALFRRAGLQIVELERGVETNFWVLQ